ncbi:MAG: F0F1 ATP synthase subunit B [Vicingaceae bacterium]
MLSVSIGTVIWTTIAFLVVVFILAKFAWKPILNSLREREESIEEALESAERAKEKMKDLEASNEKLLIEARQEREEVIKSAREAKEKMISEAKDKAKAEADKVLKNAQDSIRAEKASAISELKSLVGELSVEIAEKILKQELSAEKQKALIEESLKDAKLN